MRRIVVPSLQTAATVVMLVAALLWGGSLALLHIRAQASPLDRIEYFSLDQRFLLAGPSRPPRDVVIVALDDETIRVAGGFPLARDVVAKIVSRLADAGARTVAVDIAFLDVGAPEKDEALIAALTKANGVVSAVGTFETETGMQEQASSGELALVPRPDAIIWPFDALRAAVHAGLVNVSTDHEGVPRFMPLIHHDGRGYAPSFDLAAAAAARGVEPTFVQEGVAVGGPTIPVDFGQHLALRFYGPRGAVKTISAAKVLDGTLDPALIKGGVALIGATAVGLGDKFATPFDRVVPGVEIHATAIDNLLEGRGLVRDAGVRRLDAAATMLLPIISVLLLAARRPFSGAVAVLALLALWFGFTFLAFERGYWFAVAAPLAATVPIAAVFGTIRLALERRSGRQLETDRAALLRFQSPAIGRRLMQSPDFLAVPRRQQVAVAFVDLSGFTSYAEKSPPVEARDMLADFHALIEREIVAREGYVVSFSGDGAMIVFGLPDPKPDDAARAIIAMIGLYVAATAWLATLPPHEGRVPGVRLGGHFGDVVASRLGSAHHQHITATGDTVNSASRLLEVAKAEGGDVVLSETLLVASGQTPVFPGLREGPLHEVRLRGRESAISLRTWSAD